jgi:hypothetical protein
MEAVVVGGGGVSPPRVCTAHRSNGLPRSGSSSVLGDICSRMATCGLLLGNACRAAHMYAAGVMAVLVLGGSRSRVGMAFSLSVHRRAVCSFALSAALCKSAGGITTCTSSPFFAAHTHPLYLHHHHPHPSLPHRPRACSCFSQPARALSTLRPAAEVKSSASTARPTAHRPLCRSTLFDRALRNESTPPRPRLYNHPDHRSPLANAAAAVSIPTPA